MRKINDNMLYFSFKSLLFLLGFTRVLTYNRNPCPSRIANQFQFPDCYVPDMDSSLLLTSASFLFSHNAATGYLPSPHNPVAGAISSYGKNQLGTVYEQLQNGARALDLRPYMLSNGTMIMHHGGIHLPVSLGRIVSDAVQWCEDNPEELVLIFHSNLFHESSQDADNFLGLQEMKNIYNNFGVNYLDCSSVYGLTVGDTFGLASINPKNNNNNNNGDKKNGYLLALDAQDYYGSFCGKMNWIEDQLVTCYPKPSYYYNYGEEKKAMNVRCTEQRKSKEPFKSLKNYILQSANNDPTDYRYELGPPEDLYNHPFNEIQAFWQVDTYSIKKGLSQFSNLLDDNKKSRINENLVQIIYNGEFKAISLFAIDNVALNGNAILSVLRNQCGQSSLDTCGAQIPLPKLSRKSTHTVSYILIASIYLGVLIWMGIMIVDIRRVTKQNTNSPKGEDDGAMPSTSCDLSSPYGIWT